MFSSSYSSNPFPGFPSSSSSYPPHLPFLTHENAAASADNILILHDPLAAIPFINTNNAPIPEAATNLAVAADCPARIGKQEDTPFAPHFLTTKRAPKKDRHSKIYTSQGLRDRRVRLSIEIARKFFDLQDMLGFDKASNTLEWLFTKSKKAIKDLARSKNSSSAGGGGGGDGGGAKSFSSSSECDEVVSGINHVSNMDIVPNLKENDDSYEKSLMGFDAAAKEKIKLKRAQKDQPVCVRAKKESREKARARARERTSYKMCTTTSTGRVQEKRCSATEDPQTLHQLRSLTTQPADASLKSPRLLQPQPHPHPHPVTSKAQRDNLNFIEESIVIKRKLKPPMIPSHQRNLVIPKEPTLDQNEQHPLTNLATNWDTNGAIGRSSFCAFASMNLSTELQIFGKPWEECNNQQRLQ